MEIQLKYLKSIAVWNSFGILNPKRQPNLMTKIIVWNSSQNLTKWEEGKALKTIILITMDARLSQKQNAINSDQARKLTFRTEYLPISNDGIQEFTELKWGDVFGEWAPYFHGFNKYDESGRLTETYKESDTGVQPSESQTFYYYGDNKEYESIHYFVRNHNEDWKLDKTDTLSRIFNEEGLLIKESEFRIPSSVSNDLTDRYSIFQDFQYYCDGSLKELEYEHSDNSGIERHKTVYEYESLIRCKNEFDPIELTIFPNPASVWVHISSPILTEKNTEISIFSLTGIFISSQEIENLTTFYELNISDLQKGTYIIQVGNEHQIVSKKIGNLVMYRDFPKSCPSPI